MPINKMLGTATALTALLTALTAYAQSSTTSASQTLMSSSSQLKLARNYTGSSFFSGFSWFTDPDPTGGYVTFVHHLRWGAG